MCRASAAELRRARLCVHVGGTASGMSPIRSKIESWRLARRPRLLSGSIDSVPARPRRHVVFSAQSGCGASSADASTAGWRRCRPIPEMLDGNMKTLNAPSAMFIAYQNGKKALRIVPRHGKAAQGTFH